MLLPSRADHKFLEIAVVSGCPILADSQSAIQELSLVLALNKESLILDPIDWPEVIIRLNEWSSHTRISERTNVLFRKNSSQVRATCLLLKLFIVEDEIGFPICFQFSSTLL